MSLLKNKKFRSDLTFVLVSGAVYVTLTLFLTLFFSFGETASFLTALFLGMIFLILNAMKLEGEFKKLFAK